MYNAAKLLMITKFFIFNENYEQNINMIPLRIITNSLPANCIHLGFNSLGFMYFVFVFCYLNTP